MKTELVLPIEMYKLSLEEIGAIFILMASPHMDDKFKKYWEELYEFKRVVKDLVEDEIVLINKENGELQIDLTWV